MLHCGCEDLRAGAVPLPSLKEHSNAAQRQNACHRPNAAQDSETRHDSGATYEGGAKDHPNASRKDIAQAAFYTVIENAATHPERVKNCTGLP
jgi:hypothetical protein